MLFLHGLGHFFPDVVIDNAFLQGLEIETSDEWILDHVGIRERRSVLSRDYIQNTKNRNPILARENAAFSSAEIGAKAARMGFERAKIAPEKVGLVISGSCSSQYLLPANAAIIAAELGISAECWDVNSACSTFAAQIHLLNRMNGELLPDFILLVIPETWTLTVDYSDRTTAVLIGDAAAAAVISTRIPSPYRISHTSLISDPIKWNKIKTEAGRHFIQEGKAIQKFAIQKTIEIIKNIETQAGLKSNSYYFIGHQANALMLESVCRQLDISAEKHLSNVKDFGNTGAAGAPSVLSQNWDNFKSGDKIALAVVGAGLSWGGLLVEVGEKSA